MTNKMSLRGENKVSQSHSLVEGLHKTSPLTLQESRIVLTTISTIQPHDTVFDSQRIPVQELLKLFNITEKNHKLIEKACDSLSTKFVKIKEGKSWTNYPWFQKIKYHSGEGVIEFQFPNDFKPYLLELKKDEGFTSYRLENILQLSSPYSHRIYEICFKWRKAGGYEFELEFLKNLIGATKKSYDTFGNFKQRVLDPAVQEVSEKTDIKVAYEVIKEGRKVVAIHFTVQSQRRKNAKSEQQKKLTNTKSDVQPKLDSFRKSPNFDVLGEFQRFLDEKESSF